MAQTRCPQTLDEKSVVRGYATKRAQKNLGHQRIRDMYFLGFAIHMADVLLIPVLDPRGKFKYLVNLRVTLLREINAPKMLRGQ
jgi:hypothetical protein